VITLSQRFSSYIRGFDLIRVFEIVPLSTLGYQWWRPLTANLVHSYGIIHLIGNMFCLGLSGPIVEQVYGKLGFLIIYCVSGYLAFSVRSVLGRRGAGASASVVGVIAAMCLITIPQIKASEEMRDLAIRALTLSVIYLGMGLMMNGWRKLFRLDKIDVGDDVHVVGFIVGLILSLLLR
jgi:membrane associated rhomboid family serine protease